MRPSLLAAALVLLPALAQAKPTCISGRDINSTARPDDNTILFYLNDKSVYRNDLPVRCPGLKESVDGFTFEPTDPAADELCDGMVTIHMIDMGHAACILGKFTRVM
jgi:hypothetical protein